MAEKKATRAGWVVDEHGVEWEANNPVLVLARLLEIHNRLLTPFNAHLKRRHNISLNEFRVFMTLGRMEAAAAHELADATGLSTMTVSRSVAALEAAGRVNVRRNEENRRSNMLTFTPEGARLFEEMRPVSFQVAGYLLDEMPEAERITFSEQLGKLLRRLQAVDEHGRSLLLEATRPRGS